MKPCKCPGYSTNHLSLHPMHTGATSVQGPPPFIGGNGALTRALLWGRDPAEPVSRGCWFFVKEALTGAVLTGFWGNLFYCEIFGFVGVNGALEKESWEFGEVERIMGNFGRYFRYYLAQYPCFIGPKLGQVTCLKPQVRGGGSRSSKGFQHSI